MSQLYHLNRSPQFCRESLLQLEEAPKIHKSHHHIEQILLYYRGVVGLPFL